MVMFRLVYTTDQQKESGSRKLSFRLLYAVGKILTLLLDSQMRIGFNPILLLGRIHLLVYRYAVLEDLPNQGRVVFLLEKSSQIWRPEICICNFGKVTGSF